MPEQEIDPEDRDYLAYNWGSLPWSDWVPFNADKHTFHTIPMEPGVYRIRRTGADSLMYVGETGRTCFERLNELRQTLRRADLMPWNDPHTAAPGLWCWWKEWIAEAEKEKAARSTDRTPAPEHDSPEESAGPDGEGDSASGEGEPEPVMLECSAAPLDGSASARKGMEAFLLYRYRQERGESTLCNFGRFHPRYRKSTNRKEGRRGGKLADGQQDNPAGFPGIDPLEATGRPGGPDWMGLEWPAFAPLKAENIQAVGPGAGLYLLADAATQEIVYIGQSADIGKRLADHSRKAWDGRTLSFSCQIIGQAVLPHNLRELENDLLGNFFEHNRRAPEFQFRNSA